MKGKSCNNYSKEGPAFIGVGPEKTGTSWIDRQLRAHPAVWMPPIKELRYFWEDCRFPGETFWQRLAVGKSWHRQQYARYGKARLRYWLRHPIRSFVASRKRFVWDVRYLFKSHDDLWYLSCFKNSDDRISGEISPQYFFLPLKQIEKISCLLPNCKILITLRRPMDWVWSFAKMNSGSGFLQEKFGSMDAFINSKISTCSFSKSLANWRLFYPEHQTRVLFYENLASDPWNYYQEICNFLEIRPDINLKGNIATRVNVGPRETLPNEFVDRIKNGWKDDIHALSNMVSDLPYSWLE